MKNYQKLWKFANKIIPGGNGLLSKRPQRFSPNNWPIYYTKAKDIYLDLEVKCPDRDDIDVNFYGSRITAQDVEDC